MNANVLAVILSVLIVACIGFFGHWMAASLANKFYLGAFIFLACLCVSVFCVLHICEKLVTEAAKHDGVRHAG